MPPPEVVLVTQQARSVRSGVGTYARVLLEHLTGAGLGITVATWSDETDPESFPSVHWIDLGDPPRFDPTPGSFYTLGKRAAAALAGVRADVVHFLDAREAHAFVRGGHDVPVVGTVHDDYAANAPAHPFSYCGRAADPLRRWLYYRWLARLERRCYARTDLLLVNSSATGRSVTRRYGVPEERLRHVHLCVAPAEPGTAEPLAGEPAILFSGGNFYRKGLDTLLRSLKPLATRMPQARLHVAGHDAATAKLQKLAARLGVQEHVSWHGRVAPARMAAMTAGADIFAMPSRTEALGLVYLEAFRAWVPVVAGSEGGVTEIVRDRFSGLVVPPEDPSALAAALFELARDESLRARVREGGRQVLAERTPERLVAETVGAYGEVAQSVAGAWASTAPHAEPVTSSSASTSRRPIAVSENVCS